MKILLHFHVENLLQSSLLTPLDKLLQMLNSTWKECNWLTNTGGYPLCKAKSSELQKQMYRGQWWKGEKKSPTSKKLKAVLKIFFLCCVVHCAIFKGEPFCQLFTGMKQYSSIHLGCCEGLTHRAQTDVFIMGFNFVLFLNKVASVGIICHSMSYF